MIIINLKGTKKKINKYIFNHILLLRDAHVLDELSTPCYYLIYTNGM